MRQTRHAPDREEQCEAIWIVLHKRQSDVNKASAIRFDVVYLTQIDLDALIERFPALQCVNFLSPTYFPCIEMAKIVQSAKAKGVDHCFCSKLAIVLGGEANHQDKYIEFTWARPQQHEMIEP